MSRRLADVYPLDRFGFRSAAQVARLGKVQVDVTIGLGPFPSLRSLAPLTPRERGLRIRAHYRRLFERLRPTLPAGTTPQDRECRQCRCTIPASTLRDLRRHPSVQTLQLNRIAGRAQRRQPQSPDWYAVKARFAIQVEGQVRGMQSVEERIVLVRALDNRAARRAEREFERDDHTYVGATNRLVRWRFEEILDVYSIGPVDFSDPVIEVYSVLKDRRLPEWSRWPYSPKTPQKR